jgi:DNA-binding Lrp family transcriptional regulator
LAAGAGGLARAAVTASKELEMITAIVMIGCEVGKVHTVAEALMQIEGVAEVYSVSGPHDIMALVRVKAFDSLATVVSEQIGQVEGIRSTQTNMAFRCYSKHDMERMWAFHLGE